MIVPVFFGVAIGYLMKTVIIRHRVKSIDKLKNALLAHALLMTVKPSDDTNYAEYDGSAIPPFSGSDVAQACFTYFSDGGILRTQHMIDKIEAIQKYIKVHLNNQKDVYKFFELFVNSSQNLLRQ